jgi:uncharacterized circularly permuted ATP-grasp superfamily protein/uncharacterized alpha-E superfamily protein
MPNSPLPPLPQTELARLGQRDADASGAAALSLAALARPADPAAWDELRLPSGALRPAWAAFACHLPAAATPQALAHELGQRRAQVQQRIRMDGVTHNVFVEPPAESVSPAPTERSATNAPNTQAAGMAGYAARPWSLELLPLIIEHADWADITTGVLQRVALLEQMLADLAGPQQLLHQGVLPPALVLRHPGWLRPLQGHRPPGGQHLYVAAFDLARQPDGRWCLVAQRTQGPSGLGYMLHNRLVVGGQFAQAFQHLRVQRIASAYRQLLSTVEQQAAAVAGHATPRLVLLTPGPYSETYFEHAYLARYLGLPLVEGGDLTVRGARLYMKTVEGLEPVHGVLRRLDDDWCDPLELRADSTLGVPGLLQATRAGTVVLANALGSGFLESPAIQGYLPAVAQHFGGPPLHMPALPSWWCGDAAAWQQVRGEAASKVLRSTYPRGGRALPAYSHAEQAVQDDADAWTLQDRLSLSRAPLWGASALEMRPAVVRVYAIADGKGGWQVMPGGMTRVAQRNDGSVSMQRGGSSLDTWVRTDGPLDRFSMLPQRLRVDDLAQRRRPVSSRTGENLFWLGRYTERTEQSVRLARALLLLLHTDTPAPVRQALSVLAVRSGLAPLDVPTLSQSATRFERSVLSSLTDASAAQGACSIAFNLAALERAAQSLRERLSPEHWGVVRTMGAAFAAALAMPGAELPSVLQVVPALDHLGLQLAAVTGMQTDRMTRDHGWRLLTVGRLIERLQGVALRLEVFLHAQAVASVPGVELLVDLLDSLITFRGRYQRHEDLLALADLLVLDATNPRSLAGVLRRLRMEIDKLPGSAEQRLKLRELLPAEGAGLSWEQLRGFDETALSGQLRGLALSLGRSADELAERVGGLYFTPDHGLDQRV